MEDDVDLRHALRRGGGNDVAGTNHDETGAQELARRSWECPKLEKTSRRSPACATVVALLLTTPGNTLSTGLKNRRGKARGGTGYQADAVATMRW